MFRTALKMSSILAATCLLLTAPRSADASGTLTR
jgi:hypothetical protein